jgi:D-inositol-3-phosphate glycosyltransferase
MEKEEGRVRVLFIADLVTPTGFSRVSHAIIDNISHRYNVCGLGINYFGDPHLYHFPIFPAGIGGDYLGLKRLDDILIRTDPEIIFILNDVWVVNKYLDLIKKHYTGKSLPKIVTYFPIDAEEHDPDWYKHFDIVSQAVTYTEFAKNVVSKVAPEIDVKIIPHGVNKKEFFQLFSIRKEAKKILFSKPELSFLVEDSFIFLNANRNQARKKVDITIEAFKLFAENKPDNVRLYLHMGIEDAAVDIVKFAKRLGIFPRVLYTNMNKGIQKIPTDKLNLIYNATDVGLNSGLGEGWSLTNMEHAVTGAPQVVADHSALSEIYKDIGLLVPPVSDWIFDKVMTRGKLITAESLAEKMELIYSNKELYTSLSLASKNKFLSPEYSWEVIGKQWNQVFKEVLSDNKLSE